MEHIVLGEVVVEGIDGLKERENTDEIKTGIIFSLINKNSLVISTKNKIGFSTQINIKSTSTKNLYRNAKKRCKNFIVKEKLCKNN